MSKIVTYILISLFVGCSPKYLNVSTMTYPTRIGKIFSKNGEIIVYYRVFRDNRTGKIISSAENFEMKEDDDVRVPKLYITDEVAERYRDKDLVLERSFILLLPKNYKMEKKNEVF